MLALTVSPARAQQPRRDNKLALPSKALLLATNQVVETELAALMQWRGEIPAAVTPRLEMQIDLRIIARWLLTRGIDAGDGSDIQAAAYLRAGSFLSLAKLTAVDLAKAPPLSPQQADAMAKLHAMTFNLPTEIKSISQLDNISRDVAMLMSVAGGPLPPGTREFSLMRPRSTTPEPGDPAPPPLNELVARARSVAVSPMLRKQIALLAQNTGSAVTSTSATQPAAVKPAPGVDPKAREQEAQKARDEADVMQEMLGRAVIFAEGLQKSTSIDPQTKAKIEAQLAEGLTLFGDSRTRGSGAQRVDALDAQRKMLDRMRQLNLAPDMQQRIGPAFSWAQENLEQGPQMFEAVEQFLKTAGEFDARGAPPALPAKEAKLRDDLLKQLATSRGQFLDQAGTMKPGAIGGATPDDLKRTLADMKKVIEQVQVIEKLPRAVEILNVYRPKPFGALERRVTLAVQTLSDNKPSLARDESQKFVTELVKLATVVEELGGADGTKTSAAGIPPEVAKLYARDQLVALDAKRKAMLEELLVAAAGNREIERRKVAKLELLRDMLAKLREAAIIEGMLVKSEAMTRWADWGMSADLLNVVLQPYRDAMMGVFDALAAELAPPPDWAEVQARYAPLLAMLTRDARHADALAALPQGLVGELSRLVTPMHNQPFGPERFATLAVAVWSHAAAINDQKAVALTAEVMSARLNKK